MGSFRCASCKAREGLLQKAEALEGKPRLAGFAGRDLRLEMGLELGQRPIEFIGSSHHLARLADAFDRLFEDVDGRGHRGQSTGAEIVPAAVFPALQ